MDKLGNRSCEQRTIKKKMAGWQGKDGWESL